MKPQTEQELRADEVVDKLRRDILYDYESRADDHWHASKVQDAMAEIKDSTTRVIEYVIAELKVELFERDGRMENGYE